jgi:hypothetical protein
MILPPISYAFDVTPITPAIFVFEIDTDATSSDYLFHITMPDMEIAIAERRH